MIKLYAPKNDVELVLIQSILDGEGINYFILNNHFGSLKPGPAIWLYNNKIIMVPEADFERAGELIVDYLAQVEVKPQNRESEHSLFDKIRMGVEFVMFGWFMPGKIKRANHFDV
ncbi:MAG: DUF2007 domain-containing protein [Desulfobacteraceae bacterium]|nr:MAG: DUF2007 domain-containing protein [Desulfobacteraceae bacterium]